MKRLMDVLDRINNIALAIAALGIMGMAIRFIIGL